MMAACSTTFPSSARTSTRASAFYDTVLAAIGGRRVLDFGTVIGYGVDFPDFWIGPVNTGEASRGAHRVHARPTAPRSSRSVTRRRAWVPRCCTSPGVWPEYHPNYFGAFVRDPDGNNVEAVCHTPE